MRNEAYMPQASVLDDVPQRTRELGLIMVPAIMSTMGMSFQDESNHTSSFCGP